MFTYSYYTNVQFYIDISSYIFYQYFKNRGNWIIFIVCLKIKNNQIFKYLKQYIYRIIITYMYYTYVTVKNCTIIHKLTDNRQYKSLI